MKQWYEELFENFAESYDNEHFTQGTLGECDFIESEIASDKNVRVLDIGLRQDAGNRVRKGQSNRVGAHFGNFAPLNNAPKSPSNSKNTTDSVFTATWRMSTPPDCRLDNTFGGGIKIRTYNGFSNGK